MRTSLLVGALLLTALLPAIAPTAAATADLCERYGICPILRVGDDYVCAGVGLGLQGIAACGDVGDLCARVLVGFHQDQVCAGGAIILP